jgi:UDP-GlcNAc:undecaprenyl-phosphate GlcNAc-1-phosphate transferase
VSQAALDALPVIAAALAGAALLSLLLTPLTIRYAARLGAIDQPDSDRRIHERPIPRTGGIAVAASFVIVGLTGLAINAVFHFAPPLRAVRTPDLIALFLGVGLGGLIGFVDDRFQLRARWQFIGQFLLAGVALALGIAIQRLPNPFGDAPFDVAGSILVNVAGYAFDIGVAAVTTIWVVGMLNSVNFVDGLDGLLGGIALIAVATLGVISLLGEPVQPAVAVMCALLAGALLGFLPYNFHPARVFIGTSGVLAVGYALAVLSVLGTAKVALALLVLGVPIIDTFWIIIRRVSAGHSPFSADRGHFHHRLLDLGLSHRQAVLLIYLICTVLAVLSLILPARGQITAFLLIVLGGGALLYLLTRRARGSLDRASYDENQAVTQPGPPEPR